jgi:hypothetical protein
LNFEEIELKNSDDSTPHLFPEDKELFRSIFYEEDEDFMINGVKYSFEEGLTIIKKKIIYLIMILDNFRLYIKIKTNNQIPHLTQISPMISDFNEKVIRNKIKDKKKYKNNTYKLDQRLLQMTALPLIEQIRIEDIAFFLKISQLNFLVKNPKQNKVPNGCRHKTIFLKKQNHLVTPLKSLTTQNHDQLSESSLLQPSNYSYTQNLTTNFNLGVDDDYFDFSDSHSQYSGQNLSGKNKEDEWINFIMFEYEIDEIILAKRKRPDEELKHSFKAVRKGIEKHFKMLRGVTFKSDLEHVKRVKEEFNEQVLENNPVYIEHFARSNITKEVVADLKKCSSFVTHMNEYIQNHFLREEIEVNVLFKKEEIMSKKLTLKDFLLALMTKQKKNGWIVQNVLNSLGVLENCSEETILKRKSVKRKPKDKEIKNQKTIDDGEKKNQINVRSRISIRKKKEKKSKRK